MIYPEQLIAEFQIMYDDKWQYQWGAAQEGLVDCSGAFAYSFNKLGGYMYHGSNTMWRKYTAEKGELYQVELVPGMAVFLWRPSGQEPDQYKDDGQGDYYHVGLFIGNGEVIEAKSTEADVVISNISHWHSAARLTGVDYSGEMPETPSPDELPVLRMGSTGYWVTEAQLRLIDHGFPLPAYGADGIFGQETNAAVIDFQTAKGLIVDGVIGPETWTALYENPSGEEDTNYKVIIPDLTFAEAEALKEEYPQAIIEYPQAQQNG